MNTLFSATCLHPWNCHVHIHVPNIIITVFALARHPGSTDMAMLDRWNVCHLEVKFLLKRFFFHDNMIKFHFQWWSRLWYWNTF